MWPKSACLAFPSNTLRSEKQYLGPINMRHNLVEVWKVTGLSTNCINGSFDLIAALVAFLVEVSLKVLLN